MRIVSAILALLFLLTGTGAAGNAHEVQVARVACAETHVAAEGTQADHPSHDAAHCTICVAIAAAHATTPMSPDVDVTAHRLIARRLAIDGDRPTSIAPARRSCRDPPVIA